MWFQLTICLLLCTNFITSTIEEPYRLGSRNAHLLFESFEEDNLLDFNEYNLASSSEDDIETDHNRVKRTATEKKEQSDGKAPVPTKRPSTPKPTTSSSKLTTKRPTKPPIGSSTEKAPDDAVLNDPQLTIDDNELSNSIVYSKVNESLKVVCKADLGTIEWRGPKSPFFNNPILSEHIEKNKLALTIKSIKLENEGKYTCKVSKKTATKKKSFKLKVIDPVQIIEFPQTNLIIAERANLKLQCNTTGYPKAIVNWSFKETVSNGSVQSLRIVNETNSCYKLNGDNLLINNITLREAGKYTCEARQDIEKGTVDNKTVEVVVHHKPYPTQNLTTFEKAFNSIVEIPCKMISNPAAYYTWFRKIGGIYQIVSVPSVHPVLTIKITNSSQYGEYKCTANNELGSNNQYILLTPKEFQDPAKIEFVKVTDSVVYFKAVPENGTYLIHYKVQYKKKGEKNWTNRTITSKSISEINHKLTNLTEKTTYILRVKSINEFGISAPSNEIEFTTKEFPRPPKIEIEELTNDQIYFNIISEKNRTLTKCNVEYKTKDAKNWIKFYFIIPKGATWRTKYYLRNLTENTNYILRVRSINELGISAPSNQIEFTTKELPRPPKITIKKLANNFVCFNAATESNRTLIGYNADYKTKDAKKWKTSYFTIPKGATWNTKYFLRNLSKNTTYILRVRSVNDFEISAPSKGIEFTTLR